MWERVIDQVVTVVEYGAAAFLAIVTALTFVSVIMRYVFAAPIPDTHDLTRLMMGIALFWGFACACWRGEHIQVDLLWTALPRAGRIALDLIANLVLFVCVAVLAWTVAARVLVVMASGITTMDFRLPMWPFIAVATLGLFLAVLVIPGFLYRVLRRDQ